MTVLLISNWICWLIRISGTSLVVEISVLVLRLEHALIHGVVDAVAVRVTHGRGTYFVCGAAIGRTHRIGRAHVRLRVRQVRLRSAEPRTQLTRTTSPNGCTSSASWGIGLGLANRLDRCARILVGFLREHDGVGVACAGGLDA